jgi:hypothetical protein
MPCRFSTHLYYQKTEHLLFLCEYRIVLFLLARLGGVELHVRHFPELIPVGTVRTLLLVTSRRNDHYYAFGYLLTLGYLSKVHRFSEYVCVNGKKDMVLRKFPSTVRTVHTVGVPCANVTRTTSVQPLAEPPRRIGVPFC